MGFVGHPAAAAALSAAVWAAEAVVLVEEEAVEVVGGFEVVEVADLLEPPPVAA